MSDNSHINEEQFNSHRYQHQPDTSEDAVRFHELDKAMPGVYDTPQHYTWDMGRPEGVSYLKEGEPGHHQAIRQLRNARGNPEARVMIYRAVPQGVTEFKTGDWVTTSIHYAADHAKHEDDPKKDKHVLKRAVKAKDISFGGNDAYEFGYMGPQIKSYVVHKNRYRKLR